jgi:hypothetical protein
LIGALGATALTFACAIAGLSMVVESFKRTERAAAERAAAERAAAERAAAERAAFESAWSQSDVAQSSECPDQYWRVPKTNGCTNANPVVRPIKRPESDEEINAEIDAWGQTNSGSASAYGNYLKRFPNGRFASTARRALRDISNSVPQLTWPPPTPSA